ncbi:MAG: hypothetical protein HY238_09960 [Acidobacteria bacterium]|nr:hypothetical protein [Acidobacteriota bacterium]
MSKKLIWVLLTLTLVLLGAENLLRQPPEDQRRKSEGCVSAKCHVGIEPMHASPAVRLGCTDCHGGNAATTEKKAAHVEPRHGRPGARSYTQLNRESPEYVRFLNPGDLRIADQTCGTSGCHDAVVYKVRHSLMTHGGFLWAAALYNNGAFPLKDAVFGESYNSKGVAQKLFTLPPPNPDQTRFQGILPLLQPLPQFEATQPGNTLRVFERGEERLSNRGFGTLTRTDPVFQGLQKTRLLDPLLSFLGTNDHPGDYRSSGCTACHVVYANDRDPIHSGPYAAKGHTGLSYTNDPTTPKNVPGHPIAHRLTRSIPSSQCVVCHMHPGTSYAFQYLGYMWWDNETDGGPMYPPQSKKLSPEETARLLISNPESASLKGYWSDPKFLNELTSLNPKLKQTQFADFNGHGWVYRAVFKHDRKGTLLDAEDRPVDFNDPDKFKKAVHLRDIHLEKGMHCNDCHFEQDSHGNGKLYGEARAAVEIDCADCHGTMTARANLKTSGPASPTPPHDLSILRTPFGAKRFEWFGSKLIQRSMVEDGKQWEVSQVLDSITPGHPRYNEKSRKAKTIQGHSNEKMSCYACHTSWMTSCFGCHLVMRANANRPTLHWEGDTDTRNFTSYNFQVLRDDVFMLGLDSTVKKHKIAPVRSSSAILVASRNASREWIYSQQQTISAEGYSGQAFNPHFPHTVRTRETRTCTDCHLSAAGDNNAWMAQLLLQGTNFVNFMGRYIYVGEGGAGFEAVVATERDEPQAVMGSYLHKLAYPENYARHQKTKQLTEAYHHEGSEILSVQMRGEYLYAAKGKGGVEVYDIAQIDNKGFAQRMISAPVSPLGQRFHVKTKDARWVASPTTLGVDPARRRNPANEEQPIHLLYAFLYVADREEGLILINAATLLDGDPRNNFLKRAVTFNPDGILKGAVYVVTAGNYAYVSCDRGVVIIDISNPLQPKVVSEIPLKGAGAVAIQFRYAFICDAEGLKIADITDLAKPVVKAAVPLGQANDVYVARTYAYVAAGPRGLAIIDVESPEKPGTPRFFTEGGINDARAVKVGMTNASLFAYVADGHNGLRVLQLTSPAKTPGNYGFSPELQPELIATYKTKGPALALSKGLDRDRAVDESGNQLCVFGRRGARPFNRQEMERLYIKDGKLYTVTNEGEVRQ